MWDTVNQRLFLGPLVEVAGVASSCNRAEWRNTGQQIMICELHAVCQLIGRELLSLQGMVFDDRVIDDFSEAQLTDLAGNASGP